MARIFIHHLLILRITTFLGEVYHDPVASPKVAGCGRIFRTETRATNVQGFERLQTSANTPKNRRSALPEVPFFET